MSRLQRQYIIQAKDEQSLLEMICRDRGNRDRTPKLFACESTNVKVTWIEFNDDGVFVLDVFENWARETENWTCEIQNRARESENWTCEIQNWARESENWTCEIQNWACEIQNWARESENWTCEIQNWTCEIENLTCEIQNWACESENWTCEIQNWACESEIGLLQIKIRFSQKIWPKKLTTSC